MFRSQFVTRFGLSCLLSTSAAALALAAAAPAWAQSAPAQHSFDIPALPLNEALRLFMQQSGIQVSYASGDGANVRTSAVKGDLAPAAALSQLLTGTGLTYRFTAPTSAILEPAPTADAGAVQLGPVRVGGDADSSRSAIDAPPPAHAGGQVARGGNVGMLGNRDIMETPFNQTSYTSELIENQQARTIGDVLDNDPSIRRAWPASGLYEYFQIRGFNVNSSDIAFDGLYGLMPRYGAVPVEFAERVEVLKGPSALLSGMSPNGVIGGAINIVPKRADDTPLTRLTLGLESDSLWRAHLDFGRRFGPDGAWGVRVNASVRDGDTYIDGQSKSGSNTESLALDYRGERVRLALDAYRVEDRNRGGASMAVTVDPSLTSMPRAPDGHTNISPWIDGNAKTEAAVLSGEYDLADNITAFAKAGVRHYRYDGFFLSTVYGLLANGNANVVGLLNPFDTTGFSEEVGVRGTFVTGPIKHTLVLSGSWQQDNIDSAFSVTRQTTNIYNPVPLAVHPADPGDPLKNSRTRLGGGAVADTMEMLDGKILLTAGIRRQNVASKNFNTAGVITASYDKAAWTPMAGLVVRPAEHLSLYGNYIQGLSQGTTVGSSFNNAGEVLPPYKSKQIEVGAKLETGTITNTLSFFQIEKPSTLTDYSTSPLPTLRLNGEQRNRGIEWTIFGEVTPGLRVLGGVTYINGRLTKTQGGTQDGNAAPGAAPWSTNLGAEWDMPWISGFTLTGRVINTSSQYLDNDNKVKLPSWTRLDLGARYRMEVSGKTVYVRGTVQNVFNKNYWEGVNSSGSATLSAPRTFQISASVDF